MSSVALSTPLNSDVVKPLQYQSGFCSEWATEALPGALPIGRNSPQRCPYGLYAEQYSGTAFTAPRHTNRRSWLYRIRPAALHSECLPLAHTGFASLLRENSTSPNQLRWSPLPIPPQATDFIDGFVAMAGNGSPESQVGCGIYVYAANRSMHKRYF
jgi:homogentisate 1,2-dioxygenase